MLSIIADNHIPSLSDAFQSIGDLQVLDAASITPEACSHADILLVRSVTPVNKILLETSPVVLVGSATAGFDHIDQTYLKKRGIEFVHAPGSNAESVVEYVLAAVLHLSFLKKRPLEGCTLGVIGCGNIGGRLAQRAPALGLKVLKNDPPLANINPTGFVNLETVLEKSDILSLHVPKAPDTIHLIGEDQLQSMRSNAWLLNTSRGNVVDNQALKRALKISRIDAAVLDVWEHEPAPDLDLLNHVALGTPHIAGHSVDGKLQGTIMLYHAITKYLGIEPDWDFETLLQKNVPDSITVNLEPGHTWLTSLARRLYDICADDTRMRTLLAVDPDKSSEIFRQLRGTYPPRRSFRRHRVTQVPASERRAVRDGLCVGY